MQLNLVGINHDTAPLDIREKAAINVPKLADSLSLLQSHVPNGVILSTCNRTEIYTVSESNGDNDTEKATMAFLKTMLDAADGELSQYVYAHREMEVAKHLFRVASGLESMVVGEFEVLGQVRQALEAAEKIGMVNFPLRYTLESAIRTGRLVREQTGISRNALSVSSVAVDLAANITGDLKRCRMLVIGAGDAGRLVAQVARERGVSQIVIASRTKDSAQALATALQSVATDLSNIENELSSADIVVTCAGAPHRLLNIHEIEQVMKNRPALPLVIIDIALPRNVEPEVANIPNVFLYNIDGLNKITDLNRKQRENEVHRAEQIITDEVLKFGDWWHELEIRPVVGALMTRADEIRLAQLNKTLKRLPPLSDEQRENLEAMTKSIVARILNDPIQYLKTNGDSREAELIMELFHLNAEGPQ